MTLEQIPLGWFMNSVMLVSAILAGVCIWKSSERKKSELASILRAEGSLPAIAKIICLEDIRNAWCRTDLDSSEVVLEVREIGRMLKTRNPMTVKAVICGEEVNFFVRGSRIILKVTNHKTKVSIQCAFDLIMTRTMCKDLYFWPRLEFMD